MIPCLSWRWAIAIGLTAIVLFLAGCVPSPPPMVEDAVVTQGSEVTVPDAAATSVARQAQEVTVRIRVLRCDSLGTGSGFVLPGGLVVTNRHVVGEPVEVSLNSWDGRSLSAEVTGIATDSDLAVLRLDGDAGLPAAIIRERPAEVGEPVLAVGYPGGGPVTVSTGRVVAIIDGQVLGEATEVLLVDAPIRRGNSGGPLLDEQGQVIGVVFALEEGTNRGVAVPVAALLERLERQSFTPPARQC
jgi:S1-C subfamily serine protease